MPTFDLMFLILQIHFNMSYRSACPGHTPVSPYRCSKHKSTVSSYYRPRNICYYRWTVVCSPALSSTQFRDATSCQSMCKIIELDRRTRTLSTIWNRVLNLFFLSQGGSRMSSRWEFSYSKGHRKLNSCSQDQNQLYVT